MMESLNMLIRYSQLGPHSRNWFQQCVAIKVVTTRLMVITSAGLGLGILLYLGRGVLRSIGLRVSDEIRHHMLRYFRTLRSAILEGSNQITPSTKQAYNALSVRFQTTATPVFPGPTCLDKFRQSAGHFIRSCLGNSFVLYALGFTALTQYGCSAHLDLSSIERNSANDTVREDNVVYIEDNDHRMDMNRVLLEHNNPIVVYNLTPTKASCGNFYGLGWTFAEDGQVVVSATDSDAWTGKLWNYQRHTVAVGGFIGLRFFTKSYNVYHRHVSQHTAVHLFVPTGSWSGLRAVLGYFMLPDALQWFNPVVGDWISFHIRTNKRHDVTLSRVNTFASATLAVDELHTLANMQACSSVKIYRSAVKDLCGNVPDADAANIVAFVRENGRVANPEVFPRDSSIVHYQYYAPEDDCKPSVGAFMAPIALGAHAPVVSVNNDVATVKERLVDIKSDQQATDELEQYFDRFLKLLVPDDERHKLRPMDLEEVKLGYQRPVQKVLDEKGGIWNEPKKVINSFMKKETYGEIKPPRNISTMDPTIKTEYLAYTGSVGKFMKRFDWYGFGHPPREIAARVARICSRSKSFVNCTDASRMDGRVSYALRSLERKFLLRLFDGACLSEITRLHSAQYDNKGFTAKGVAYNQGSSRASGSGETSSFNTLTSKFMDWLGRVLDGASDAEAFNSLAIFAGDDALSADLGPGIVKAGDMVGQVVKNCIVERGALGVNFLSRYYTQEVWAGNPDSLCDLPRQLIKFHITVDANCDPLQKLKEKALSFYLTDQYTPLIGQYVTRVMELANMTELDWNNEKYNTPGVRTWWSCFCKDDQYPQSNPELFLPYLDQWYPEFDYEAFIRHLDSMTQLDQCLNMPMFLDPKAPPEDIVIVAGDPGPLAAQVRNLDINRTPKRDTGGQASKQVGFKRRRRRGRRKRQRSDTLSVQEPKPPTPAVAGVATA